MERETELNKMKEKKRKKKWVDRVTQKEWIEEWVRIKPKSELSTN